MFQYIPGQAKSSSAEEEKPADFMAPDLQELVARKVQEQNQCTHEPTDEDWEWLRGRVKKILDDTDMFSQVGRYSNLPFEERGKMYRYRQAIRDLPDSLPPNWTRESIVWPQRPL